MDSVHSRISVWLVAILIATLPQIANAENLMSAGNWPAMASDQRASRVGDVLTVLVVQAAESSTTMLNNSRRSTNIGGTISAGPIDEAADVGVGSSYSGRGEVRRAERLVTQLTVTVSDVLPNGDLVIGGTQNLSINGETTVVGVRGRIRLVDLDNENRIASNRIADAQISYNGQGFVSRSSRPGLINRIFGFLGLG